MKDKIQKYEEDGQRLKDEVKQFVQDKTKPLEERWEIFCLAEMGERGDWVEDFDSLNKVYGGEVSWYDDFCVERMQTVYLTNVLDTLTSKDNITEEQINEFKEEVLQKFIWSFEFDW